MGFVVALAIVLGTAIGRAAIPTNWPAIALAIVTALTVSAGWRSARVWGIALAACIATAAWSGWTIDGRLRLAGSFPPGTLLVARGFVADTPLERDTFTQVTIATYGVRRDDGWREEALTIGARAAPGLTLRPGEHVEVAGWVVNPRPDAEQQSIRRRIEAGTAAEIERTRLSRLDPVAPSPNAWLLTVRERLAAAIRAGLPEPEAALATGILVGDRSQIPPSLRQAFNDVGVSHLIAISGYNVTIVIALIVALLCAGVGRRVALLAAIPTVVAYAVLVGGSPSVTRATAMAVLFLLGLTLGREPHLWTSLAVATAALLIMDPALLGDASFQLSVVATAGVAAAAPFASRTSALFVSTPDDSGPTLFGRAMGVIAASSIITVAATIATAPIIAADFSRLSLVGPLANLAIGWALLPIMATSLMLGLVATVAPSVAVAAGALAWPFLWYFVTASTLLASSAWASVPTGVVPTWSVAAYYVAVVGGLLLLDRRRDFGPITDVSRDVVDWAAGRAFRFAAAGLVGVGTAAWSVALMPVESGSVARFLDLPGEAILVQSSGRTVLLDGGTSPSGLVSALGSNLPFGQRQIDLVILTGLTNDRTRGLRGLAGRYRVAALIAPDANESFARDLFGSDADLPEVIPARAGQRVLLPGAAVAIDILDAGNTAPEGGSRMLVRIHSNRLHVLLAGPVTADGLRRAVDAGLALEADIARVPQGDRSGEELWPHLRRLVMPRLEVVRAGQPGETGAGPTHRLGLDGPLTIALD